MYSLKVYKSMILKRCCCKPSDVLGRSPAANLMSIWCWNLITDTFWPLNLLADACWYFRSKNDCNKWVAPGRISLGEATGTGEQRKQLNSCRNLFKFETCWVEELKIRCREKLRWKFIFVIKTSFITISTVTSSYIDKMQRLLCPSSSIFRKP